MLENRKHIIKIEKKKQPNTFWSTCHKQYFDNIVKLRETENVSWDHALMTPRFHPIQKCATIPSLAESMQNDVQLSWMFKSNNSSDWEARRMLHKIPWSTNIDFVQSTNCIRAGIIHSKAGESRMPFHFVPPKYVLAETLIDVSLKHVWALVSKNGLCYLNCNLNAFLFMHCNRGISFKANRTRQHTPNIVTNFAYNLSTIWRTK